MRVIAAASALVVGRQADPVRHRVGSMALDDPEDRELVIDGTAAVEQGDRPDQPLEPVALEERGAVGRRRRRRTR